MSAIGILARRCIGRTLVVVGSAQALAQAGTVPVLGAAQESVTATRPFAGHGIREWTEWLAHPNAQVRQAAAFALAEAGPAAAPAIEALIDRLDDSGAIEPLHRLARDVRGAAIRALAAIGSAADTALQRELRPGAASSPPEWRASGAALACFLRAVDDPAAMPWVVAEPERTPFRESALSACPTWLAALAYAGERGHQVLRRQLIAVDPRQRIDAAVALAALPDVSERARSLLELAVAVPRPDLARAALLGIAQAPILLPEAELAELLERAGDLLPEPGDVAAALLLRQRPAHAAARQRIAALLLTGEPSRFDAGLELLDLLDAPAAGALLAVVCTASPARSARRVRAAIEWRARARDDPLAEAAAQAAVQVALLGELEPFTVAQRAAHDVLRDPEASAATRRSVALALLHADPADGVAAAALVAQFGRDGGRSADELHDPVRFGVLRGWRTGVDALRAGCLAEDPHARLDAARLLLRWRPDELTGWGTLAALLEWEPDELEVDPVAEFSEVLFIGVPEPVVAVLANWMRDDEASIAARWRFVRAVAESRERGRPELAPLRSAAIDFLATQDRVMLPRDDQPSAAAVALRLDPRCSFAIRQLLGCFASDDRRLARSAMYELQHADDSVLVPLARRAIDPTASAGECSWSAYALGARAGGAVAAMRIVLRDGDPDTRSWLWRGTIARWTGERACRERQESQSPPLPRGQIDLEERRQRGELRELARAHLADRQRVVAIGAARCFVELEDDIVARREAIRVALAVVDACGPDDREIVIDLAGRIGDEVGKVGQLTRAGWIAELSNRARNIYRLSSNRHDCVRVLVLSAGCLEPLLELRASPDPDCEVMVAWALRFVVDQAEGAHQALLSLLEEAKGRPRYWAADSLLSLDVDVAAARHVLEALAADATPQGEELAAMAKQRLADLDAADR